MIHYRRTIPVSIIVLLIAAFPAFSQTTSWTLVDYVKLGVEVSTQIDNSERAVTTASERLEEVRLSDATELDLDTARTAVETARLSLAETVNAVAYQGIGKFVDYQRAVQALDFARRQLEIKELTAEVSKQRYDEGVKTEAAYLGDFTSYLNSEIAYLQSKIALESARRGLLRFVDLPLTTMVEVAEVKLPYITPSIDSGELVAAIQASSSSYFKAMNAADVAQRRFDAISRLSSSVTQKELESAELSAQTAALSFKNAAAGIEDQVWSLLATLDVLVKSVEAGEQIFGMSENTWAKQEEQHEFGLISDLQRDTYQLNFEKSRNSAVRKVEDHFFHIMKIEQAKGGDLIQMLGEKIR